MNKVVHPSFQRPIKSIVFPRWKDPYNRTRVAKTVARKLPETVAIWWRKRQLSGNMFNVPAMYKEGEDYKGELPWPAMVANDVLYNEFVKETRETCSIEAFLRSFRLCAKVQKRKSIHYRQYAEGRSIGMRSRTMYFLDRGLTDPPHMW